MEKIKSNIYIQFIFILIGIILFFASTSLKVFSIVSITLASFSLIFLAFGMVFLISGIKYKDKKIYIQRINKNLKNLNYTQKEIKERQNYLNNISIQKLKEIDYTLQQEIRHIDDDNFYSPIKENIK